MKIIFFGTPEFAKDVLETLSIYNINPSLIVTQEDKPVGRKMIITPPAVKVWAEEKNIPYIQPKTLRSSEVFEEISSRGPFDLGIVASYGKIIPKNILDLAKNGLLNIHPSLLPLHRGASPIHNTILSGDPFGVTIILLDEEMDHGPILIQKEIPEDVLARDSYRDTAEKILAQEGGVLIKNILEKYIDGKIKLITQNHTNATFCKKITKEDGLVDLINDDPLLISRKVHAFTGWPGTFFFTEYNGTKIRVQIIKAHLENGKLKITSVKPEGKKEMIYNDFLRGNHSAI
ncbi:MAG: methionyl-tRNA formyltransferase [Minisyncoccota bacterium]